MSANMTNTRVKNPFAIIELYLTEKPFLSFYGEGGLAMLGGV